MNRIQSFAIEANRRLRLTYSDGVSVTLDVQPLIDAGGVFAALRDDAVFNRVKIGAGGRSIEWPGDIDLCADALLHPDGVVGPSVTS